MYYHLFLSETLSMVLIALHCIVHDHRNRNLQHYLLAPMRKLGKLQKSDGSFGSIKSTALAIQALQATDPGGNHWNRTNAISYVKQQQNDNGSFGEDEVILFSCYPQNNYIMQHFFFFVPRTSPQQYQFY